VGTSQSDWMQSKYWKLKRLLGFPVVRSLMWWEDAKTAHLDELELSIDFFETRISRGLSPKFDSLRAIVSAARSFSDEYVPSYRTDLSRVPRSAAGWIDVLTRVLREAEDTALLNDPDFVTDVALAFRRLGCNKECVEFVIKAIEKKVQVRPVALNTAIEASKQADVGLSVVDLQMMTMDETDINTNI
jgi:hypothetical protein